MCFGGIQIIKSCEWGLLGVGYEGRLGLGDVPSIVTEERRGRGAQRSDQSAMNRAGVATSQPAC